MKIKKDYERSIDLLLEREGMDREEINARRQRGGSDGFDLSGSSGGSSFLAKRPSFKSIAKTVGKLSHLRQNVATDEVDGINCSKGDSILHKSDIRVGSSILHGNSSCVGNSILHGNSSVEQSKCSSAGDYTGDSGICDSSERKNKSQNSSFKSFAKSVGKIAKIFKKK